MGYVLRDGIDQHGDFELSPEPRMRAIRILESERKMHRREVELVEAAVREVGRQCADGFGTTVGRGSGVVIAIGHVFVLLSVS